MHMNIHYSFLKPPFSHTAICPKETKVYYSPYLKQGAGDHSRNRNRDLLTRSRLLYRLSYCAHNLKGRSFIPLNMSIFQQGKYKIFLSKCWEMPLFPLQLSKFSGEAFPQTPLEKLRPGWLLCPSLRKILLFHKISLEALKEVQLPCMLPVV